MDVTKLSDEDKTKCGCWACYKGILMPRMILCKECGIKRCPKANNHRNKCTNSNATGQPGSAYE